MHHLVTSRGKSNKNSTLNVTHFLCVHCRSGIKNGLTQVAEMTAQLSSAQQEKKRENLFSTNSNSFI